MIYGKQAAVKDKDRKLLEPSDLKLSDSEASLGLCSEFLEEASPLEGNVPCDPLEFADIQDNRSSAYNGLLHGFDYTLSGNSSMPPRGLVSHICIS